jgi:hypothetical protein
LPLSSEKVPLSISNTRIMWGAEEFEAKPCLGGPSLIDARNMFVEKRYFTARLGR